MNAIYIERPAAKRKMQAKQMQKFLLDNGRRLGTSIIRYKDRCFDGPMINGCKIYNKIIKGSDKIILEQVIHNTFLLQAKNYLDMQKRIDNIVPMTMTGRLEYNYGKRGKTIA